MSLFGNKDKDDAPKRQSLAGFLFKPDIAGSIRPIGESISMFVKLIAWIFVANKLFPADHPALANGADAPRLTMAEIIGTAWRGLSFTKAGIPQVLLFIAVVGCLALSALSVVTIVLSFMVGKAHAASSGTGTGMFDTPDTSNDLAYNWLQYLFLGQNSTDLVIGQITIPQSQNIQDALKTALAFYSNGILVFAGFILLYHLVSMIAETAHSGTPMGKNANQIWAPIRLVFAIGLLVPISGGLNTGQYLMVQMADWGSGLASQTWGQFLTAIEEDGQSFVPPTEPDVAEVVKGMAMMYACQKKYNLEVMRENKNITNIDNPGPDDVNTLDDSLNLGGGGDGTGLPYIARRTDSKSSATSVITNFGVPNIPDKNTICGSYQVSKNFTAGAADASEATMVKNIYDNNATALTAIQGEISDLADDIFCLDPQLTINGLTLTAGYQCDDVGLPANDDLRTVIADYRTNMLPAYQGTFQDKSINTLLEDSRSYGWAMAGAIFNNIARTQGKVIDAGRDSIPIILKIPANLSSNDKATTASVETATTEALKKFRNFLEKGYSPISENGTPDLGIPKLAADAAAGLPGDPANEGNDLDSANHLLHMLGGLLERAGVNSGLYESTTGQFCPDPNNCSVADVVSKTLITSVNPLAALAAKGHQALIMGFSMLDNVIFNMAPHAAGADTMKSFGGIPAVIGGWMETSEGAIMGVVTMLATVLLMAGVTLSFVLPLMPFAMFFFACLSWIVSVFEAVVSMPLWALAHLTTKGEGLPGEMAKQGYFFIFFIFLRPVLTVFGLIAGLLIFSVAISLLNMTYVVAASGAGNIAQQGSFASISKMAWVVFYAMYAYICANGSFKTVDFFSSHAPNWMNVKGPQTEKTGDKQLINSMSGMAGTYLGNQAISTMMRDPAALLAAPSIMQGAADQQGHRHGGTIGTLEQINQRIDASPDLSPQDKASAHKVLGMIAPELNKRPAPPPPQ